jgi:dihydrofolate synthase/folylpolyglutamate synthase
LQQAGYKVGLYTSPHLKDFRERMRVDGEMIPKQKVVNFVDRNMSRMQELGLSFFEMTTAMAFDYFDQSDVEVAVIETGLGGRLDATNIIVPLLSVVTNIGLDHTDLLGNTLQQIASEKAGIMKKCVPLLLGESNPLYDNVFEQRAKEVNSKVMYAQKCYKCLEHRVDGDVQYISVERVDDGHRYDLSIDLLGEYQYNNVITASAAVHYLHSSTPLTISRRAFVEGVASAAATTNLMGRWQTLSRAPFIVCDTGHNAHGIRCIADELQRLSANYSRLICVVGFAREKSLGDILPMLPRQAYYIFTQANISRALPAEELASQAMAAGLTGEVVASVAEAVAKAKEIATESDMIFIGGSNFVVAEVL